MSLIHLLKFVICISIVLSQIPDNTDKTPCTCDLTARLCDVNCCCDDDCTASDRSVFSECIDHFNIDDSQMCVQKRIIYKENVENIVTYTSNNMMCVRKNNYKERLKYVWPEDNLTSEIIDEYLSLHSYNFFYEPIQQTSVNVQILPYKSNGPMFVVLPSDRISRFDLSTPLTNGDCSDYSPVAFLKDRTSECSRSFIDFENTCRYNTIIDANNFLFNFKFIKSPQELLDVMSNSSSAMYDVPIYNSSFSLAVELGSTRCFLESGLEYICVNASTASVDPPLYTLPGKGPAQCSNVASSVHYNVQFDPATGISRVILDLEIRDISAASTHMQQSFSVRFYTKPKDNVEASFKRSGHPGYLIGLPVLAGKTKKTVTTEKNKRTYSDGIQINEDNKKWLTMVTTDRVDNQCEPTGNQRIPVTFGEDMYSGCKIKFTLRNLTNGCTHLQDLAMTQLNGDHAYTVNRIAGFGDSSLDDPQAWIPILGSNFAPSPSNLKGKASCRNIPVNRAITILFGMQGDILNPQRRIVGARFKYTTQELNFKCVGINCRDIDSTNELSITSSVSFLDVTQHPELVLAEKPRIPIRLPVDFFYPFV